MRMSELRDKIQTVLTNRKIVYFIKSGSFLFLEERRNFLTCFIEI